MQGNFCIILKSHFFICDFVDVDECKGCFVHLHLPYEEGIPWKVVKHLSLATETSSVELLPSNDID